MTTVLRNWTSYLITKAYQNGQEYNLWHWDLDGLFVPSSMVILNALYNTRRTPAIREQLWDIIAADGQNYYHYVWLTDTSTTAYQEFHLACFTKHFDSDPSFYESSAKGQDRIWLTKRGFRMKRDWNNVKASVLYSEEENAYSPYRTHYYCINATNASFTARQDLGYIQDSSEADILAAWTTSCGITAEESVSGIGYTNLSIETSWIESWFHVRATLVRNS